MSTATITASYARAERRTSRPALHQSPTRPAPASVRLTRRGRLVVVLSVLALALTVFAVFGSPAVSTGATHHAAKHTVVVGSGETLWDIASRIAPGEDPRSVIAEIVDLNNLSDAGAIRIGQKLFVPAH